MREQVQNAIFKCKCKEFFVVVDISCPLVSCPFCDGITNKYYPLGEFRNMDLYEIKEFL